jgi:hypothetical protein
MKLKISESQLKKIQKSLINEDLSDKDNQLIYHLNRGDFFLEKVKDHINEISTNGDNHTSSEIERIESIKSSIENISINIQKIIQDVNRKDKWSDVMTSMYQDRPGRWRGDE